MTQKYKITDEIRKIGATILYRIEALKNFGNVKAGDKGGWIEKEGNLSQVDDCWVYGPTWVYGTAWVYGDAMVSGDAMVGDNARICGDAVVSDNAKVSEGHVNKGELK